jgi:hypothetical protein
MPGLTDRRAVRVAALALPAAAIAAALSLPSAAEAAPPSAAPKAAAASATAAPPRVDLKPSFTTLPVKKIPSNARKSRAAAAPTPKLQTFTSSFRYASEHKTYSYTMVGFGPGVTKTAKIPNVITPIRFRFAGNRAQLLSTSVTKAVRLSGLFTAQAFPGGKGQYGDVFMRTQFWSKIRNGARAWHVTMAPPPVTTPLALSVPSDKGGSAVTSSGATVWLVDIGWFDSAVAPTVAKQSPAAFTQFLGANVVFCGKYDPDNFDSCGIGGYHSATESDDGIRTYSYQSYLSSKIFGVKSGFHGLAPMSHELAEWLANPYLTNQAPRWTEKSNPQYGCSSDLEVGDPLVGKVLKVGPQIYQDEAYLSYFARQKPSIAWKGRYSWFNNFKTYSRGCK